MRLFLDTSVLLAASGSTGGASREIFRLASNRDDFEKSLGGEFYSLAILTPGRFLVRERAAGRLHPD